MTTPSDPSTNRQRFTGRRVVVTGAGSGIGLEMARQFAAEGALVATADLDISEVPAGALAIPTDVGDPASVEALIETVERELGGIDVMCNNAGIGATTNIIDATVEEWDRVMAVNARGTFLGMKYVLPHMLTRGKGVIVNTASVVGMVGFPDRATYSASKGAVIALTRQAAVQWATAGIRCNCICPGTVDSPWVARLLAGSDAPDRQRAALVARQPLGRLAQPAEVAAAALYLASDDAAFVTGTELIIDGGICAG